MTVRSVERVPIAGVGELLASRMTFSDPWDAARFLHERAEEDAADPVVRAYALAIVAAVARELGESGPMMSARLRDAVARALWKNVQTFVRFIEEPKETFQTARVTLMLGSGDCDDHALLLFALARAAGVPVQMLFLDEDDQPVHVVDRMADSDGSWQWAETTVDAAYGEEPLAAVARLRASGALTGADALSHTASMGDVAPAGPAATPAIEGDADPSDVIAYRQMWDPYVTGAARAIQACAAAQTDATLKQSLLDSATLLMMRWNVYAGLEPYEILLLAGDILTSYQTTVLKVGPDYLEEIARTCPQVALPTPPTSDLQAQVIGKLEGARIIAAGVLQLIGQGVGGALAVIGPVVQAPFKAQTWSTLQYLMTAGAVIAGALAVREVARDARR
jgi:hypothetical protein